MLTREIKHRLNVIECECISCANNKYNPKECKSPIISIDDKGRCKCRRRRY